MSDKPATSGSASSRKLLKVVLLADRFEVRGSSAYTLRLARHLPELGCEVRIVCPDADAIESHQQAELPLCVYPRLMLPVWGRVVQRFLRDDLEDQPPDLIHVQSRSMLACGNWLARELNLPLLVTLHDYLQPRERLRLDTRWAQAVIAVSASVRSEVLNRCGLPEARVHLIHGGVEVPKSSQTNLVLPANRAPVVGAAGPLEAVKGLPFFLGAAGRVLQHRPDVQFLVAGAGPEEANLRRLARTLGLTENLTFVPKLYDYSQSLEATDIFCLPSLKQGLGTIMLEAMALGKPVIATGVGGVYSAIRDDHTGLVVPPSNSERLAERIIELLGDPVRARSIGEAGRRLVAEQFNVTQMVEQTADLYRSVLEEFRAKREARKAAQIAG